MGPAVTTTRFPSRSLGRFQHLGDASEYLLDCVQASHPLFSGGEVAADGFDKFYAVFLQLLDVCRHKRVFVHVLFHRGRDQDWAVDGDRNGGECVVCDAVRHFSDDVCGGGDDC